MTTRPAVSVDGQLEELSDDECRRLLSLSAIGRIAFVVDGLPMLLPVNYRLLNDDSGMWILLRTRPGNAIDDAPERVAFEIDGVDYDDHTGWSVLVRGVLHHLDHNEVELFSKRFDPKPWTQQERTSWLAIKPQLVTGRRLRSDEPGWAFWPDVAKG
jgi:nitroimidazol reductase NimA-like FMN-containing flavoprotein (pyridoxamine 5'-phosphate oxidase superfamily)